MATLLHINRFLLNGYIIGMMATVTILCILWSFQSIFDGSPPLLLFLVSIMLASWRGGFRAGISTTVLSIILSAWFLVEPYHSLLITRSSERLRIALLFCVGGMLSLVISRLRDMERQALHATMEREEQLRNEIAERKQAEIALKKTKDELEHRVAERTRELQDALQTLLRQSRYVEALFQHSITPLVFLDRDFNYIRVNQAYAKACQKEMDEFPGHNHFKFYPSDTKTIFEQVLRTKQPFQAIAHPFVFPDHPEWGVIYWDWMLTPLLDDHGEVEALVFALEDVTVRKCAEVELEKYRNHLEALVQEQTRELEVANARLQADIAERERAEQKRLELENMLTKIADTAPGVMCSFRLRPDGTVCFPYASPAIKDIYGITPDDLKEDAAPIFALVHPDDAGQLNDSIAESAHSLLPWHAEYRVRHPMKGEIWVEGHSVPEAESDGGILWYGFIHDITERKRAEEALKAVDRRKNEFLAMLGHELRNPLAPIRNAVQILKTLGSPDPTVEWSRNVIDRQAGHMARLLDDLLDIARIMQNKITLKNERFELSEIMDSAVETCRPLIESRRQDLAISHPATPQWLEGDRVRLAQVLSNLLNNAAKYTGEGGKIRLSATREGSFGIIRVQDTGTGITPEILPHIFDLFIQADRSLAHAQGGLGIGLTLVRRLVEMHGGTVTAASAGIGQGSEFTVRLPLLPEEPPVTEFASRKFIPLPSTLRILVVDDYADVAESLAVWLRSLGHKVDTASCGVKAIERAPIFRPHVVLLDIGLPDLDGFEVARRLRELPETRQAVLIALTGYGQPEDQKRSQAAGFDHHLLKPVDSEVLSALLASVACVHSPLASESKTGDFAPDSA